MSLFVLLPYRACNTTFKRVFAVSAKEVSKPCILTLNNEKKSYRTSIEPVVIDKFSTSTNFSLLAEIVILSKARVEKI